MWHITTTISGHRGNHVVAAAVFWIFVGIIIVVAFGDALAVLAVAVAISWIYRKVEHRSQRSDAEMAPVTRLRPELTRQRDFENTSASASRRFHRAA